MFAGYGLDMPARGFDDYRGLDVRGKIVVVLDGTPERHRRATSPPISTATSAGWRRRAARSA